MPVNVEGARPRKRRPIIRPTRSPTDIHQLQLGEQPQPGFGVITVEVHMLQPGQQRMPHPALDL